MYTNSFTSKESVTLKNALQAINSSSFVFPMYKQTMKFNNCMTQR